MRRQGRDKLWVKDVQAVKTLVNCQGNPISLASWFFVILLTILSCSSIANSQSIIQNGINCNCLPEMIVVAGGEYYMGGTDEEYRDDPDPNFDKARETPRHLVSIKTFALAKYDVTRKLYGIYSDETGKKGNGCKTLNINKTIKRNWHIDIDANWKEPGFDQTDNEPVVCVSWYDAIDFIEWLNGKSQIHQRFHYRLPTEEEWEFTARAGTTSSRYWGDTMDRVCEFENTLDMSMLKIVQATKRADCEDGYIGTSPVGSFKPNPWGFYDMLGNVYQWTMSCSTLSYDLLPFGYSNSIPCNSARFRGASWSTLPFAVRSATRSGAEKNDRISNVGFRLAADIVKE